MFSLFSAPKSYRQRQRRQRAAQALTGLAVVGAVGVAVAWVATRPEEVLPIPVGLAVAPPQTEPEVDLFTEPGDAGGHDQHIALVEHPLREELAASAETTTTWNPSVAGDTPQWVTVGVFGNTTTREERRSWSDFDLAPVLSGVIPYGTEVDAEGKPSPVETATGVEGPLPALLGLPEDAFWPQGLFGGLAVLPEATPEPAEESAAEPEAATADATDPGK